ncbi:hypothetical protein BDV93DRAFT_580408 [Ceratobasidium sp. AG-I]|nr:hypothetical protein BDV93DRAFT_580408 [Ceratobasidium sp. AG-I]
MAVEQAIESSSFASHRRVKIQAINAIYFGYISGLRASGCGAAHQQFRDHGQYMVLGDVKVYRRARGVFDVHISFKHHKGYNSSVHGLTANHVYRALEQIQNLILDPIWVVAHLFSRGALKYKTLEELFESTDHELVVTKPDEPYFLKVNSGGHDFEFPQVAALASNILHAVSGLLHAVGLQGSMYAL